MVKADEAELLAIMNALQMGDKQMDTGLGWKDQPEFDPRTPLWPADVCWIMDQMTTLEVGCC